MLGCPMWYVELADKCYRFHQSRVSWHQAEAQCKREGANLASVTTQAQYWALLSYMNDNCELIH